MSYENNWFYDKQRDRKRVIQEFSWDRFSDGLVGPKVNRPKLGNIKMVDLKYKIVKADGQSFTSGSDVTINTINNSNLNSAARTIFKENYEGIKQEYKFIESKYSRALPGMIEEINGYYEKLGTNKELQGVFGNALKKFAKTGELKEEFLALVKKERNNPSQLKSLAENGSGDVENFIENFSKTLMDCYKYLGGKEQFLSLDSELATNLKKYQDFEKAFIGGTYKPGDLKRLEGSMWKLFSAPMEAMGAYVVSSYMEGIYDEVAKVVGGESTKNVAQGKTDFSYGSLGISAKNYFVSDKGNIKGKSVSYHSGDLSKILGQVGFDNQLQILYTYAVFNKESSKIGFENLADAIISSVAIAGFPGDRVQLMLYANKVKPVYEYFDRDSTNSHIIFNRHRDYSLEAMKNIIDTKAQIKISGDVVSRFKGRKF